MKNRNGFFTTQRAIIFGSVIISLSILIHGGIIKIPSKSPVAQLQAGKKEAVQSAPPLPVPQLAKVSADDDPVLGNKDAGVTLIEFSDYECPFCKRHFDEVFISLKKDYIDTGKLKLIFRDYPLSFHDPMATFEANAANCAREQGGDSAYYKFHDAIFAKTKSNGSGLTKEDVYQFASDLGLNQADLKTCADSLKYGEEVKKDLSDGSSSGVSGTPSFFIGKSDSSGTITGEMLVGAQPFSSFKEVIDRLLK